MTQESQYNGSYETDVFTDDQSAAMPKRSNTRFSPEKYDDEFDQMSVTISGSINDNLDVILTSSIFERDTAYTYDYASYVEYYAYAAYPTYVCDGTIFHVHTCIKCSWIRFFCNYFNVT